MYYYKTEVLRVVDGDTVDVRMDLGFNVWHKCRVRLLGINAPESRTRDLEEKKRGLAAKAFLIEVLETAQSDVELQSHGTGKYGRVLGEFYINGVNINDLMVKEGHAVKYDGGKR
jgi:micrococcal nuclease|tara:strand:- start:352 stop:696 length:345 start_codon:yes stop_codon:yes gene_type:complete